MRYTTGKTHVSVTEKPLSQRQKENQARALPETPSSYLSLLVKMLCPTVSKAALRSKITITVHSSTSEEIIMLLETLKGTVSKKCIG